MLNIYENKDIKGIKITNCWSKIDRDKN